MELGLILRNRSVDMEASVIDSYRQYKAAVADIESELEEVRPALVEYLTNRGGKITDGGASLQLVEVNKFTWNTPALLELLSEFNVDQSVAGDWTIKATDANLNKVATGLYDWLEELANVEDKAEVIFRRMLGAMEASFKPNIDKLMKLVQTDKLPSERLFACITKRETTQQVRFNDKK